MTIQDIDFKIIPINENSYFFDLELLKEVKGKVETREEFKNVGYGLTLENCIKKITMFRISKKQEIYTLQQFLTEYKKINDELISKYNP